MNHDRPLFPLKDLGLHGTVLLLIAFLLPLAPAILPAFIVLLIISLFIGRRPSMMDLTYKAWIRSPLIWMFGLYIWHVAGMFWSTNVSFGLFDLEIKSSLILFPLMFLFLYAPIGRVSTMVQGAFVIGNAVVVPLCLLAVLYRYLFTDIWFDWSQQLIASYFSLFLHPTYAAMYMCIALAILYMGDAAGSFTTAVRRSLAILLLIGIVLMTSKIAMLAVLLLIIQILVALWHKRPIRMEVMAVLAGVLIGSIALVLSSEYAAERFREMIRSVQHVSAPEGQAGSSALRTMAWDAALGTISHDPLVGTGTGDVKDELMKHYAENGQQEAFDQRLNAHSQILQTWAALGLPGSLLLLGAIIIPAVVAWRYRKWWIFAFLWITLLNWCVESMLEVQAGVLIFSFMAFIFSHDLIGHPRSSRAASSASP